ncbi:hypothetical protein FF38_11022 [Lucilia cuprina]|uniref:Uncharacterized protein n=1 Tax=Lucilia cuprina TaxID=7375 RepID=A0A0L0BTG2_LUCCU|nr:hypothetical protein FF38_11022 [Lucilia cuprina]
MSDNKDQSVEGTSEEYHEQVIVKLNVEIDLLNETYNCVMAENKKLRKIIDALETCIKEHDSGLVDKQHFKRVCAIAKLAIGKQSRANDAAGLLTTTKKVKKVVPVENLIDVPSTSQRTMSGNNTQITLAQNASKSEEIDFKSLRSFL